MTPLLKAHLLGLLGIAGLLSMLSCTAKRPVAIYPELAVAVVRGDAPQSVAVLPVQNGTEDAGLEELIRSSFYGHLSIRKYKDVEIHVVDERLRSYQTKTQKAYPKLSPKKLGRLLGCDAVIFGEVTQFRRVFAGIYSQMAVGASITVWDTRNGRKIWSDEHVVRYHEGGIPLNPLALPFISARSGMNLRESVKIRAVDELARYLARRIPAPKFVPFGHEDEENYAYEIQVASFRKASSAKRLVRKLRASGHPALLRSNRDDRGIWHRVLVGPYESLQEAQRVSNKIRQQSGSKPTINRVLSKTHPRGGLDE